MNSRQEHLTRPRQTVLPSASSRTLHHPSFLPLYEGFPHSQTEVFYTDPSMDGGRRIYNRLSGQRVLDCFQLNTPPPITSSCLAPPNFLDPFRSGPHPIRDLGSPTWRIHTIHSLVQPRWIVLQLTEEDDQAVTSLLRLQHYPSLETEEDCEAVHLPVCADVHCLRGAGVGWSDTELEAANTLSSGFDMMEDDLNTETGCAPALQLNAAGDFFQMGFEEDSAPSSSSLRGSGDLLEMKIQLLSDLEGVAVHMLLSLGDVGALDMCSDC